MYSRRTALIERMLAGEGAGRGGVFADPSVSPTSCPGAWSPHCLSTHLPVPSGVCVGWPPWHPE